MTLSLQESLTSDSRLAMTQPALPAPTMMKSYSLSSRGSSRGSVNIWLMVSLVMDSRESNRRGKPSWEWDGWVWNEKTTRRVRHLMPVLMENMVPANSGSGEENIIMMYFKTKILLSQKHNQHLPWKCRTRPMLTTHTCLGNVVRYPCWLGMVKREASHAMRDFFCLSKREATSLTRVSHLVSHLTRRLAAIWAIPHSHCRLTMFSECGGVEQVQFLRKYQETLYVQHFLRSKACNTVWWWNG